MSVPDGFVDTGEECYHCEDGTIWKGNTEGVCDNCYATLHGQDTHNKSKNHWLNGNRPRYAGSGRVKLAGGFLDPYEWGEEDGRFRY